MGSESLLLGSLLSCTEEGMTRPLCHDGFNLLSLQINNPSQLERTLKFSKNTRSIQKRP